MGRLIDAEKLIRRMRIDMDRMKYQYNLDVIEGMSLAIGYIVGSPTAYDPDKVIEKPVISKKDRTFLEYLGKDLKYISRDKSGALFAYERAIEKGKYGWVYDSGVFKNLCGFSVDFPTVKWSDDSPWLIEDLKKLKVVDSYE